MHYTCAMVSLAQSPPDASHVRASGVILRYDDATCSHIATLDVSHHFDNNFCKHFIYWHVFYPCKLQTCALLLYATRTSGAWGTFVRLTLCTDRAGSNPHTRCVFFFCILRCLACFRAVAPCEEATSATRSGDLCANASPTGAEHGSADTLLRPIVKRLVYAISSTLPCITLCAGVQ